MGTDSGMNDDQGEDGCWKHSKDGNKATHQQEMFTWEERKLCILAVVSLYCPTTASTGGGEGSKGPPVEGVGEESLKAKF